MTVMKPTAATVTRNAGHHEIVDDLANVLNQHEEDGWSEMLASSIREACVKANKKLKGLQWDLFQRLPDGDALVNWPDEDTPVPETLEKYYQFLDSFVRWLPTEKKHDEHVDRCLFELARFYWLIDQPDGLALQQNVQEHVSKGNDFTDWMVRFAKDWGSFLNTSDSLTWETLETFYEDPSFRLLEYVGSVEEPSAASWSQEELDQKRWAQAQITWKSFNQFFARQTKPGMRPVAGMFDDKIICAPADFTFQMKARIDDQSRIRVKQTHTYSVLDLLEGSPYRDRFRGGLFMHSFLSVNDYHRFRAPVRGTVLECRKMAGEVFLGVELTNDLKLQVTDETGYQFSQQRGLIIFDSPIGLVAVLPMGMAQVSSVNMTAVEGAYLDKGEEFGYFQFGGSDMILMFEADSGVNITSAPGVHTNAGMYIGEVVR